MYSTTQTTGYNLLCDIRVDGKKQVLSEEFGAFPTNQKRNILQLELTKGTHHIRYSIDDTIVWLGNIVKQIKTYKGDVGNNGELTLLKASYKNSGELTIDELTFELKYEDWFEDTNYNNNDNRFNPSGFIFDYRDEVNFSVKMNKVQYTDEHKEKFKTTYGHGDWKRLFGGYISTLSVDKDLTVLTVSCASRLKDAELKHSLEELSIAGGTEAYLEYSENEMLRFSTYATALQYLCRSLETALQNNIPTDYNYLDSERNPEYIRWDYYKNSPTATIVGNAPGTNPSATETLLIQQYDQGLFLRNAANTNFQSVILFDSDWDNHNIVEITNKPNFYIQYEMGEPKWEETVTTTKTGSSGDGSYTDVPETVKSFANAAVGGENDATQIVIKCAMHIRANITWLGYKNFIHDGDAVLSRGIANCCDGSRLLAEMCAFAGVIIEYVHVQGGKGGHVFNRYNGVYYDWIKMRSASKAGQYVKGYGSPPGKVTTFPTRPF